MAARKIEVELVKLLPEQAPENYSFGKSSASVLVEDERLGAEISLSKAMPETTMEVYVVFDYGTSKVRYAKVGTFVTDKDGKGEFRGSEKFDPGDYVVGLMIHDVTNFKESPSGRAILGSVPMFNGVTLSAKPA